MISVFAGANVNHLKYVEVLRHFKYYCTIQPDQKLFSVRKLDYICEITKRFSNIKINNIKALCWMNRVI